MTALNQAMQTSWAKKAQEKAIDLFEDLDTMQDQFCHARARKIFVENSEEMCE